MIIIIIIIIIITKIIIITITITITIRKVKSGKETSGNPRSYTERSFSAHSAVKGLMGT